MIFDPTQYTPSEGGASGMAKGEQYVVVSNVEARKLSSGEGGRLVFTFEGLQGEAKGQTIEWGANIWYPIPTDDPEKAAKATKIRTRAYNELCAVCTATGVMQRLDLGTNKGREFIGKKLWILVQPQREKPEYTEVSKILYKGPSNSSPAETFNPGQTSQQAPQTPPQTQANEWGAQTSQPQQPAAQQPQTAPATGGAAKAPWE